MAAEMGYLAGVVALRTGMREGVILGGASGPRNSITIFTTRIMSGSALKIAESFPRLLRFFPNIRPLSKRARINPPGMANSFRNGDTRFQI